MSEMPPQDPTPPPPPPPTGEPVGLVASTPENPLPKDATNMAMLAHLLGLTMVGTFVVWLLKKDEHPFIDQEGKEAANFQLTALIGWVVCSIISVITCGIGALLYLPLLVVVVIFCIMGAMKAKDGIPYRYPINIRFLK